MKNFKLILMVVTGFSLGLVANDSNEAPECVEAVILNVDTVDEVTPSDVTDIVETQSSDAQNDVNVKISMSDCFREYCSEVSDKTGTMLDEMTVKFKESATSAFNEVSDKAIVKLGEVRVEINASIDKAKESATSKLQDTSDKVTVKLGEAQIEINDSMGKAKKTIVKKIYENKNVAESFVSSKFDKTTEALGEIGVGFSDSIDEAKESIRSKFNKSSEEVSAGIVDGQNFNSEDENEKSNKDISDQTITENSETQKSVNTSVFLTDVLSYVRNNPGMTSIASAVTVITIGIASLYVCKQYDGEDQDIDIENS